MGNMCHSSINGKVSKAAQKQSRRFLECIDDNFLTQVVEELRKGTHFTKPQTCKEGKDGERRPAQMNKELLTKLEQEKKK